ncbi:fibronectin type III domain-containing protein [Patescibacteria group bacterium]|nr:fibronectin type III domain-containing protein [Patescibacteria group bacterium]
MKKHISTIAILAGLLTPLPAMCADEVLVDAADTVAGLGAQIQIEGMGPQWNADIVVIPPYGEEILMPLIIKADGTAEAELVGKKTEVAGTYEVEIITGNETVGVGAFQVLPETVDLVKSTLQTNYQSLDADGRDSVRVTAVLRDRYGNTLSGRPLELISSRSSDTVAPLARETDENGTQEFEITTFEPGEISLRAMDLMSGKLLENTVEVAAGAGFGVGGYPPMPTYANPYNPYMQMYAPMPYQPQVASPSRPLYSGNRMVGSVVGNSLYGQVNGFDVVSRFNIDIPSELKVNVDTTIRITALDQGDRKVEDYTGLVLLSSTDPSALLPLEGRVQFLPQNLGEKVLTLGLRFKTPGEHLLHVEDSTNPNLNGQIAITVLGGSHGLDPTIEILSHENDEKISSSEIQLEGTGPPFINLIVTGGTDDVQGETDVDGKFSIAVKLNSGQVDHTLRVRDDSGMHDSGNIHLILDDVPPEITSVLFDPVEAIEGETVELTVEVEGEAEKVTVDINEKEYELFESSTQSGTFTLEFSAPEAGTYQPIVKAIDEAGNEVEIRNNLIVKNKGLPKVENVVASQKSGGITLSWDPIASERVDAYRIYVGKDPSDFLYTFDTDRASATATVTGLNPGTTYYFAVTALQDDRESEEKSEIIEFITPGIGLDITENDGALLIEWTNPVSDIPLSSYLLDYGVEPEKYTEQRTINGDMNAFQLHDLINDITYYLRLTPVDTTGNILHDFAAEGQGMPTNPNGGFNPREEPTVPPEVLPPGTIKPPDPPPGVHPGAPDLPIIGLPISIWVLIVISIIMFYMHWQRRKTLSLTMEFMKQMESQYRNHG